ncbi:MAG: sugar O-acetyltransferase, partial [Saprospiraceae bacterium]|nr:sugar O-acetyltransferase [Saprospiraceae bacterium]
MNPTQQQRDIFARMQSGEPIRLNDPEYPKVMEVVSRTLRLSVELNNSPDVDQTRRLLSALIGTEMHESTVVFVPFHTNFGRFI